VAGRGAAGGEFDIIARHFAPLATDPNAFGLTDDAALIRTGPRRGLVVTADAIVEGVHFLADDPPDMIARKLLRVNLSDLAAKGATPVSYMLTAAFPRGIGERWIAGFVRGLKLDQAKFGLSLLGGDTVSTPGPATFSVTMFGQAAGGRMIRRAGARAGDLVCVTGTIGDGGLGLAEIRSPHAGLPDTHRRFLAARYRLPQPRSRLGPLLAGLASAAMDVSDGLLQDLGHLARVSGTGVRLNVDSVPLSPAAQLLAKRDADVRRRALSAGDDYEIVFTLPPARLERLKAMALESRTRVSVIGAVEPGQGVLCVDGAGQAVEISQQGFDHFAPR
jgi:thiamine-monophosphate kinase